MSEKFAARLRVEARQMRGRNIFPAESMWNGLHMAMVLIADRYDEAADRIEELERRCADKDANIAELIETLQRTEAGANATLRISPDTQSSVPPLFCFGCDRQWDSSWPVSTACPSCRNDGPYQHVRGLNAEEEKK